MFFALFAAACVQSIALARGARNPVPASIPYLNTAPGVHYVGSKACAACHAEIYADYLNTAMGRSMTLPGPGSAEDFPVSPVTVHFAKFDREYQAFRRGADLFQSEYQPGPGGTLSFRDVHAISYIIGAGENGKGYIIRSGNYLFEAPLSYYTQTHSWGLSPGYDLADFGFLRPVLEECIICHSGRPEPVHDRPGLYQDPPFEELAIGCENCHGPGQLHVEERTKGLPVEGGVDRSIVNPQRLAPWLADNICMTCHQGGDARVLQPGKRYGDFRPGTPLDNTFAIFAAPFTEQSPPRSPLLQHYQLMALSKCFRASGGRLSCITCHDPHIEPSRTQAPAYFRQKCLTCHTLKSCTLPLAERLQKSDNCIGCHMPRQKLQSISHSALTNHRIIAYAGEPFPPAAFHETTAALPDLVHLNAIPQNQAAPPPIVLFEAYGELSGQHPEYKTKYEQLLDELASTEPHNSLVLSALARRELAERAPESVAAAKDHLAQAISAGSTAASDYELDAEILERSGEAAEAVAVLKKGIALAPYSTRLYKRLALEYIQLHDYTEALSVMKEELKIYPEDSFMRGLIGKLEGAP